MPSQLFIVICNTREPYVAERDLKDMGRERTISDLAAGEWGDINGNRFMVSSIIEIGTDRDVTDEFIAAAIMQMEGYRAPISNDYRTTLTGEDRAAWERDRRRAIEMAE